MVVPGMAIQRSGQTAPTTMRDPASDTSGPEASSPASPLERLRGDRRGAVFVEFLIAFLPVQVFFLCVMQSAILYSVRLVTEHAALNAARAAAVVIGDDPAQYGREPLHTLRERNRSDRRK